MQRETYRFKIISTVPPSGVENAMFSIPSIFAEVVPTLTLRGGTYLYP